uniref:Protein LEG1 homolog n=1 Tax=Echeneis naucrates TaxID=173247 RepID=A0A665WF98_ECHNA
MLRLTALSIVLALAVSLTSAAVILENGMPILWAQTASQVTELPIQNGIVTPDPWHFLNRMSLYRLMIAATDPFMGSMGPTATENPMWGLPLQLGWMLTSGRLADPTGTTTCGHQTGDTMCISPESWWGCVNYFASAIPFLSAAQQGFMGDQVQVLMQVPAGVEGYCTTYASCAAQYPDVISKWDAFFQALKAAADSPLPDNEKKDSLLGLYWVAQMASTYASAACNARQSYYSSAEVSFANSWLNSAEYIAAAHFQSNFEKSVAFITPLPGRILQEGDSAPNIADMTQEENHTANTHTLTHSCININTIVSAMCSVTTREKGREMLEQLLLNPSYATSSFLSIVTGMTTSLHNTGLG